MSLTRSVVRSHTRSPVRGLTELVGGISGPSISLSAPDFGGSTYYEGVDDDDITVTIRNFEPNTAYTISVSSDGGGTPPANATDTTDLNGGASAVMNITGLNAGLVTFTATVGSDVKTRNATLAPPLAARSALRQHETDFITSADTYLSGMYWLRPYDIENLFGSTGASVAAAAGYRYAWLVSSDHYDGSWTYGGGIRMGWSDDPGVLPERFTEIIPFEVIIGDGVTGVHQQLETPWLVYNPDDASFPFYLFCHGNTTADGAAGQETVALKSADLQTWTVVGRTHHTTGNNGHTGYHYVRRNGVNDWESWGLSGISFNAGDKGRWTSTDGANFVLQSIITDQIGNIRFGQLGGHEPFLIGSDLHVFTIEDDRTDGGSQWASLVPIEVDGDLTATASADKTRLIEYAGVYPGPTYLQAISNMLEGGVSHNYIRRAYFDEPTGPRDDYTDFVSYVYDETAAATAAPIGVKAECAEGATTISWFDALANETYRVYRGASATGPWTLVGDVTGTSIVDSGETDNAFNYYRVVTMDGASEEGERIVRAYVSSHTLLANRHYERVERDGGDTSTIDMDWIDDVAGWLATNSLTEECLMWTDPAFGVKYVSGSQADVVYDLGATINTQRGRDARAQTSGVTYAVDGVNTTMPGIVRAAGTDWLVGMDGAFNPIRRKTKLSVFSVYDRTTASTADTRLLELDKFEGFRFRHNGASPGTVHFETVNSGNIVDGSASATPTIPASQQAFISIGVVDEDAGTIKVWANGVAGSDTVTGNSLNGQTGNASSSYVVMGIGSLRAEYESGSDTYDLGGSSEVHSFASTGVFITALSDAQATSLDALFDARLYDQATAPAKVGTVTAVAQDGVMSLDWDAPADGADPITDYVIEYREAPGGTPTTWSDAVDTETSEVISTLTNGTDYQGRVAAVNSKGQGEFSDWSNTVTPEAAPDVTANLVAWWALESDGSDSAGTNTLAGTSSPTHAAGKQGNGFDGNGTAYYSVADNADIGYDGDFSVQIWMEDGNGDNAFGKGIDSFGNREWEIRRGFSGGAVVQFECSIAGSGGSLLSSATVDFSSLLHVIATYTASTRTMELFVDGVSQGTQTLSAAMGRTSGALYVGAGYGGSAPWNGRLDEAAMWKEVLTQAKIDWLYNSGAGRSYTEVAATLP